MFIRDSTGAYSSSLNEYLFAAMRPDRVKAESQLRELRVPFQRRETFRTGQRSLLRAPTILCLGRGVIQGHAVSGL